MRVLGGYVDMSACQKMTCMLIFPAKLKKQQINTHASRILAKLGNAILWRLCCRVLLNYLYYSTIVSTFLG